MKRSLASHARDKGETIVLVGCALGAYALTFIPPYSTTDMGVVVLAAAPVLSASWLFGFWGGLAAALLSFPVNAFLLNITGQDGVALLTRPGALQGMVLVLVLGVVVGGLRDVARQLKHEADARRATELARAETDERYRKLAETASDGILTMDTLFGVLYANPTAAAIFGRTREHLQRLTLADLFDPSEREMYIERVREYVQRVAAGQKPAALELTTHRPDGGVVAIEVSFGESTLEGVLAYTAIVRNVTERKEFEREVHEARVEAIRANRAKSEFISRMSHELRTPLNSILGYAQLLDAEALAPDDRDGVAQIVRAGRHLLILVDEVLDIARIEAGRLELSLEPLSPGDVTAEARDLLRPRAAERSIDISIEGPDRDTPVLADQQRLRQIMINLLSNGVKYNREGGKVRVICERVDGNLRIAVEDEGPGVPPEQLSRLFTPFDRLGAERTGIEGTGVGLSLTRHLVEAMAGDIGYEQAPSGGARFWFTLPLAAGRTEEAARATGWRNTSTATVVNRVE
ncbi:MAG TPA: ATP-binding protein [Longimicrobiales bacterium]|nr:ATP-binding protein [Longimicrobiales bacterium]